MNTNSPRLVDAIGRVHALARADARIVSLVPSVTELLFALGIGDRLVGRTGFCIHPKDNIRTVPKVGGTKSVDIGRIRELAPTHLIVNIDENEKPTIDQLANFVPNVIVSQAARSLGLKSRVDETELKNKIRAGLDRLYETDLAVNELRALVEAKPAAPFGAAAEAQRQLDRALARLRDPAYRLSLEGWRALGPGLRELGASVLGAGSGR